MLVDYFGLEVTDSLAVCRRFPNWQKWPAWRYVWIRWGRGTVEGLDATKSYAVLWNETALKAIRGYRTEAELRC